MSSIFQKCMCVYAPRNTAQQAHCCTPYHSEYHLRYFSSNKQRPEISWSAYRHPSVGTKMLCAHVDITHPNVQSLHTALHAHTGILCGMRINHRSHVCIRNICNCRKKLIPIRINIELPKKSNRIKGPKNRASTKLRP